MTFKYSSKHLLALVLSATLAVPQVSFANIPCGGAIQYLGIGADGTVTVALNGLAYNNICNVNSQGAYQMNPAACKMVYATLLADEIAGRYPVVFYSDPTITSCSAVAAWSTQPSVYFVAS